MRRPFVTRLRGFSPVVVCEPLESRRLLTVLWGHIPWHGVTAANTPADSTPPLPAPSDFAATIDNPYFPLIAGSEYIYTGVQNGKAARNEVVVTDQTRVVDGVTTTVVQA